jgi:hypothetical protein
MKITIKSRGDDTVGIFSQQWELDTPLDADCYPDDREQFRRDICNLFAGYADEYCTAAFEDEEHFKKPQP